MGRKCRRAAVPAQARPIARHIRSAARRVDVRPQGDFESACTNPFISSRDARNLPRHLGVLLELLLERNAGAPVKYPHHRGIFPSSGSASRDRALFPVRFDRPPEITFHQLRHSPALVSSGAGNCGGGHGSSCGARSRRGRLRVTHSGRRGGIRGCGGPSTRSNIPRSRDVIA